MNNEDKTNEQLIDELNELRKHVALLEELESKELYRSILEASPN